MNFLCALFTLWCAPQTETYQIERYQVLDKVPQYIIDMAHCSIPGEWHFGADVVVYRERDAVHIRPLRPANHDGYLLGISNPSGCTFDGSKFDVRWPEDTETTISFGPPWMDN